MKGWIKLTAAGADEVAAAQRDLLGYPDRKGHAGGVTIAAELEAVTAMDKLTLMSAMGNALQLDKEEWAMLFMLKMGVGPMKEMMVTVDAHGVKDMEG